MADKKMAERHTTASASNDELDIEVKLWASRVVDVSSEYSSSSWSACKVLGKPMVYPEYGDKPDAWAQRDHDKNQFIELGFDKKIFIEKINIYETYRGGSVRRVKVREQGNKWTTIWETDTLQVIETARIFSPSFQKLSFPTDEVRIETDCSPPRKWAEIDAVQIVGARYSDVSNLEDDLRILVNNRLFSDVQFQVGNRIFSAHRAILSARSGFFMAMFCDQVNKSNSKEPIPLPGIDSDSFAVVLHFIYTNTIPSDCSCLQLVDVWREPAPTIKAFYVLLFTKKLFSQVSDPVCESIDVIVMSEITSRLDVENVTDIYMKSTSVYKPPEITELKTVCMDFMTIHINEIVKTAAFTALPRDVMLELVSLMTSNVSLSE